MMYVTLEVGHEKCDKYWYVWYNCQLGLGDGIKSTEKVTKVHYGHNILAIYSNKSIWVLP
jgi:hypothetical protein